MQSVSFTEVSPGRHVEERQQVRAAIELVQDSLFAAGATTAEERTRLHK